MEPFTWSGRSGVLIARAWRESAGDEVRVRVIWTPEVIDNGTSEPASVVVVDSREALLEVVADWLAQVAESPAHESPAPAGDPVPDG
jgi:hypothetical protein